MKIVVRAPNWIGDSVLSLPCLESLSKNFPTAQIWISAKEWVKDLFISCDFIEGVIPLPDQNDFIGLRNSAKKIKGFHFDIGLLLPNSFSSALVFYLAKIPQRWGYQSDGRGLLLTKGVALKNQDNFIHQVHYYLDLIKGLGFQTNPPEINLPISEEEKKKAKECLQALNVDFKKPLIVFNPGAAYGPSKRWPAQKYAELALLFQERKEAIVLIIGSSDEVDVAEFISSLLTKKPLNLAGKTNLRLLAGLISYASLYVSNDSGTMHIANALKIPVVALFGPTVPRQTGPFQQPATVIKKEVPCGPCNYRECPFDHRCMTKIYPEEVYEAGQKFLG